METEHYAAALVFAVRAKFFGLGNGLGLDGLDLCLTAAAALALCRVTLLTSPFQFTTY